MSRKNKPAPKAAIQVTESMEHYLTAILSLTTTSGVARVRDIARHVGVQTASVTNAIGALARGGYVQHETYGYVELTAAGRKVARQVSRRRDVLLRFLTEILELDPEIAEKDACGMEHCLSEKTLERLVRFLEFMDFGARDKGSRCLEQLKAFYEGRRDLKCIGCGEE